MPCERCPCFECVSSSTYPKENLKNALLEGARVFGAVREHVKTLGPIARGDLRTLISDPYGYLDSTIDKLIQRREIVEDEKRMLSISIERLPPGMRGRN